jgi:soluble lytic murein transglycosylase-like protein
MKGHAVLRMLGLCWGLGVTIPMALATPPTWWVQPARQTCEGMGVPGSLAVAVILTESGGQPYALRVNQGRGVAVFPPTYAAGVRALQVALRVTTRLDLGLFQVHYPTWGPRLGLTAAQLLHPPVNLWAGCTILREALAAGGAPWQQIGRYHSPTPARQRAYARKVAVWLTKLPP